MIRVQSGVLNTFLLLIRLNQQHFLQVSILLTPPPLLHMLSAQVTPQVYLQCVTTSQCGGGCGDVTEHRCQSLLGRLQTTLPSQNKECISIRDMIHFFNDTKRVSSVQMEMYIFCAFFVQVYRLLLLLQDTLKKKQTILQSTC